MIMYVKRSYYFVYFLYRFVIPVETGGSRGYTVEIKIKKQPGILIEGGEL
jgi:hypothetical protein